MTVLGDLNGLGEDIYRFDHLGLNILFKRKGRLRLNSEDRPLFKFIILEVEFFAFIFLLSTCFAYLPRWLGNEWFMRVFFPVEYTPWIINVLLSFLTVAEDDTNFEKQSLLSPDLVSVYNAFNCQLYIRMFPPHPLQFFVVLAVRVTLKASCLYARATCCLLPEAKPISSETFLTTYSPYLHPVIDSLLI